MHRESEAFGVERRLTEVEKVFARAKARLLLEENLRQPYFLGAARERLSSTPIHQPGAFIEERLVGPSAYTEKFIMRVFRSAYSERRIDIGWSD